MGSAAEKKQNEVPEAIGELLAAVECDPRPFTVRLSDAYVQQEYLLPRAVRELVEAHIGAFGGVRGQIDVSKTMYAPFGAAVNRRFPEGRMPRRLQGKQPQVMFLGGMMDVLGEGHPTYPLYRDAWRKLCFPVAMVAE